MQDRPLPRPRRHVQRRGDAGRVDGAVLTSAAPALLYVVAGCPHCDAARADLVARGVPFREVDVRARRETVPELLKLTDGRRVVPVVVEGGRVRVAPAGGSAF